MDRNPSFPHQLTIESTVEFLAKRSDDLAGFNPVGLLGEMDLELTFSYWREDDFFDWELVEVSRQWDMPGFHDTVRLTRKSDPEMFAVINRYVTCNTKLDERILQTIWEMEAA